MRRQSAILAGLRGLLLCALVSGCAFAETGIGKRLGDAGIYLKGFYEGPLYANVSGGIKRASVYYSDALYGAAARAGLRIKPYTDYTIHPDQNLFTLPNPDPRAGMRGPWACSSRWDSTGHWASRPSSALPRRNER